MPGKLGHTCPEPRCAEIAPDGQRYCEKHQPLYPTHRLDQRAQERLTFYQSKAWKNLRMHVLSRQPICNRCKREAARVVHHIKAARDYPELRFVVDNLEALCDGCHNKESQRERTYGSKPNQ